MRNASVYATILIAASILGFMLAVQYRFTTSTDKGVSFSRPQELANELKLINEEKEQLKREIGDLNFKLQQIREGRAQAMEALKGEIEKAVLAAGLVAVKGPGVEVVIDNPEQQAEGVGEVFVVRDVDLLKVVNELKGAGAEAISINGQRLVAVSEIRFAGSFINVNTTRIVPPYQILAIGKPDALKNSLELPGGLAEYLRSLGIKVTVREYDQLTIPAYKGETDLQYVKPVRKG